MQNLSGTTNNVTQIFSSFEKKDFSSASTLILANINDLSGTNANGQTVLHLLISEHKNIPNYDELLNKVLVTPSIGNLINKQDNNGNTPLHIAVMNNDYATCDRLIMAGADMKIKNKAGLLIAVEKQSESSLTDTANSITSATMKGGLGDLDSTATATLALRSSASSYTVGSRGMPSEMAYTQTQRAGQSETQSIPSTVSASSVFIKKNGLNSTTSEYSDSPKAEPGILSNLINFLTRPFRNTTEASTTSAISMINTTSVQEGYGGYGEKSELESENNIVNTSEFVDELISSYNKSANSKQTGGKKKTNNNMDNDMDNDTDSQMSELSRMIQNQATEIHNRTIAKIAELLSISEDEAKVYKAFIYGQIKNEHPELNNYDRAVEMEKRITKDYLESISQKDIKDLTKTIEKNREERESKNGSKSVSSKKSNKANKTTNSLGELSTELTEEKSQEKKEKKGKKEKKTTRSTKSKRSVESSYSETSYSLTSLSNSNSSF